MLIVRRSKSSKVKVEQVGMLGGMLTTKHAGRHANCGNILIVCHVGRHVSVARHVEVRALTLVAGRFSLPVLCNSAMRWSRVPTSS